VRERRGCSRWQNRREKENYLDDCVGRERERERKEENFG
jgi:hypothetical protein